MCVTRIGLVHLLSTVVDFYPDTIGVLCSSRMLVGVQPFYQSKAVGRIGSGTKSIVDEDAEVVFDGERVRIAEFVADEDGDGDIEAVERHFSQYGRHLELLQTLVTSPLQGLSVWRAERHRRS